MDSHTTIEVTNDLRQKLAFQRGVLTLLKETGFSGPMVEKALQEIDYVIDKII